MLQSGTERLPFSAFLAMGAGFSIWVLPNLTLWAAHGAGGGAGALSLYSVGGSTKEGEGWLLWP